MSDCDCPCRACSTDNCYPCTEHDGKHCACSCPEPPDGGESQEAPSGVGGAT